MKRHAKEIWEKVKAVLWGAQLFELQDQVPCIKRNALAANKAVNAVRLTMLRGEEPMKPTFRPGGQGLVSHGKDMSDKYKESSKGGLAAVWVDC